MLKMPTSAQAYHITHNLPGSSTPDVSKFGAWHGEFGAVWRVVVCSLHFRLRLRCEIFIQQAQGKQAEFGETGGNLRLPQRTV